jgi:hypothetical protein
MLHFSFISSHKSRDYWITRSGIALESRPAVPPGFKKQKKECKDIFGTVHPQMKAREALTRKRSFFFYLKKVVQKYKQYISTYVMIYQTPNTYVKTKSKDVAAEARKSREQGSDLGVIKYC